MSTSPAPGLDPLHPFTRAQALLAGYPDPLRSTQCRRLFHGIYISARASLTPLVWAEAALLTVGSYAWASHASAARVLGLPIPVLPSEHVTVTDRRQRRARQGVVCLIDLPDLRRFCDCAAGPGAALARTAAGYVRERVDSPMESRLRMLLVLAGLPEPEVNLTVGDGVAFRKYDLSYRRSRTIVEFDGRHHIERIEQWESDLARREAIDDDAWRIIVVIADGIFRDPEKTLTRVHRILRARGEPHVPRQLSAGWRAHFPGRR